MNIIKDLWKISLARFMGVVSFALVVWSIFSRQPIDYVSYAVYAMLIVWGVVFGKNFINKGGSLPERK